jgi:hypothetical protein
MPNARRLVLAISLASLLVACEAPGDTFRASDAPATSASPGASAIAGTPTPTIDRVAGWRGDLARLVPGMDGIHPDLDHGTPIASLEAAVATLSEQVPTATDDELMVGVLRIVAMVSAEGCDGHTGAFIWGTGAYAVDSLPFRLWLFENEVVIVDALAPHEDLVGARVDSIEGTPIAEVLAALDPVIPRDNAQTVRLLTPRYLLIPQVLRGLGIADDGPVTLGLTSGAGTTSLADVEPVGMAEYNAWAGAYGLHLPDDPAVLYLSRIGEALWWETLPDAETLYVQYNRADLLGPAVLGGLESALEDPDIARVVLDVRHNFGGELSALDAIVPLFANPSVNQPQKLFVITGRNTFSAGGLLVARLDETAAVIVGEPTGGCPTLYGDPSELVLPHSGIAVSVAGDIAIGVRADDPRQIIEPDVIATLTRDEWGSGRDPALEAIVLRVP